MSENKDLPISASANSKENAFTHACDVTGMRPYYAVCVSTINSHAQGEPKQLYSECNVAIENGRCPALAMREEECTKGKAIYFRQRQRSGFGSVMAPIVDLFHHRSPEPTRYEKRSMPREEFRRPLAKPAPKKTTSESIMSAMGDHGFDKAVNKAVEKDRERAPEKKREVRPGESPLQAAKRWLSEE